MGQILPHLPVTCLIDIAKMKYKHIQTPSSIIVRMPNWIGDAVMATPILIDLKKAYPNAHITAMCQGNIGDLFQADPSVDAIFKFQRPKDLFRRLSERSILSTLKNGKYDLGILLTNSFSSAWRFFQGNITQVIGFKGNFRRHLLTYPIPFPAMRSSQHLVNTYKYLLNPLNIPISTTCPKIVITRGEVNKAKEKLSRLAKFEATKFIGFNPGAAFGSAKCWLPERFKEVAKALLENDYQCIIIIFGDRSQKELCGKICKGLSDRVINLSGQTSLREFLALIKCCSVLLTNDSGPMHIADSLEVPVVALFGSTNDTTTGPYRQSQWVIKKKVECSPCYKRVCSTHFNCMKKITAEEVTLKLLARL